MLHLQQNNTEIECWAVIEAAIYIYTYGICQVCKDVAKRSGCGGNSITKYLKRIPIAVQPEEEEFFEEGDMEHLIEVFNLTDGHNSVVDHSAFGSEPEDDWANESD